MEKICPKCGGEMSQGFIIDRNDSKDEIQTWVERQSEKSFWNGIKLGGRYKYAVQSFRCGACNFLEFYTTERINN